MRRIGLLLCIALAFVGCDTAEDRTQERIPKKSFVFPKGLFSFLNVQATADATADVSSPGSSYQFTYALTSKSGYDRNTCQTRANALVSFFGSKDLVQLDISCQAQGFIFVKYFIKGSLVSKEALSLARAPNAQDYTLILTSKVVVTEPCPDVLANDFVSTYDVEGTISIPFQPSKAFTTTMKLEHTVAGYDVTLIDVKVDGDDLEGEVSANTVTVSGNTVSATFDFLFPGSMFGKDDDVPALFTTKTTLRGDFRALDGTGTFSFPSMAFLKLNAVYDGSLATCDDYGALAPSRSQH